MYQIILLHKYQHNILSLAYETPIGVHKDVKSFIYVCQTCQMVGKPNQNTSVVPLKPIPVLGEPFSHVLVDCVGPLPKSKKK